MILKRPTHFLILGILSIYLCFFGLTSLSLVDPDDVFYAETAREMISHNSPLTPYIFEQPHFEKPPLYSWLLMGSYKLFGINSFSARFPSALFGLFGLLGTFWFVRKFCTERSAFYATLILGTCLWWIGLSRQVLTDMVWTVLIAFSFYLLFVWYKQGKQFHLILFAVLCSLAVLTKGPLALITLVIGFGVFLLLVKETVKLRSFLLGSWWIIFLVLTSPWYLYMSVKYGRAFLWEFFVHDHWHRFIYAEHSELDTWYFYPVVMLIGLFPWTGYFALLSGNLKKHRPFVLFLLSWIVVFFGMVSLAHSKLSTYIFPIFPPLTMLLGLSLAESQAKPVRYKVAGLITILLGAGLLGALVIVKFRYPDFYSGGLISIAPLAISAIIAGIWLIRRQLKAAMLTSGIGIVWLLFFAPLTVFPKLETGLTEKDLPATVSHYQYQDQPILCSKLYVRGVYFYTGNPVQVVAGSKNPFWSAHPVPVLCSDEQIRAFFDNRDTLLCILSRSDWQRIEKLLIDKRDYQILSQNIDRMVIISTRK